MTTSLVSYARSGVPMHFRALCAEIRGCRVRSYTAAGRALYAHTLSEFESHLDEPGVEAAIDLLCELIERGEDKAVLRWFEERFPAWLAMVPKRSREKFLEGVYQMSDEIL